MAIRTALLNGNNINRDTDFSKYIETVSEAGVIEGLEVTASKVGIGKARVPCERTNGETIYALVYNSSEVSISGNGDVYIQVSQTYIDDGELANEDGTGIARIQVGTMPSKNALKLATITNGVVTDARNMIPKVGELNTQIESIFDSLEDLDERVEKLEEAGAIDHLEESGLVGELYTLNDKLFKQYTPALADSTVDCNVGDIAANTQIHIQRIASGVESNQLKLKVKKTGSPTQNLIVEVRKGVQVTVTANAEAYWYGNQVVASGSIAYSSISTSYQELTVTLDNNFGGTKGELLDVVVYQNNSTVNASNYFCVACDSTQYSEGFSYVSVNGSTRTRSKLMPYCISDGFAQSLLCKADMVNRKRGPYSKTANFSSSQKLGEITSTGAKYKCTCLLKTSNSASSAYISLVRGGAAGYQLNEYSNSTVGENVTLETPEVVPSGISVAFWVGISNNGYTATASSFYIYEILNKTTFSVVGGTPYTVESIGERVSCFISGMKDGKYEGGLMLSKESTATTGSITLGNAVGYIKVNLNGEIVKIPYYSE